jgi:hypothetical protein
MRLLVPILFRPGHVVSELRGVRFSGFTFEWDMAYNKGTDRPIFTKVVAHKQKATEVYLENCIVGNPRWRPTTVLDFVSTL